MLPPTPTAGPTVMEGDTELAVAIVLGTESDPTPTMGLSNATDCGRVEEVVRAAGLGVTLVLTKSLVTDTKVAPMLCCAGVF